MSQPAVNTIRFQSVSDPAIYPEPAPASSAALTAGAAVLQDKRHYASGAETEIELETAVPPQNMAEPLTGGAGTPEWDQSAGRRRRRGPRSSLGRVRLNLRLERPIAEQLVQVAQRGNVSLATAAAALLEAALLADIERQQAAMLKPMIEETIRHTLEGRLARLSRLQVRTLYEVGRVWQVTTNLLLALTDMDEESFRATIRQASEEARKQFYLRSERIRTLVSELEAAMSEAEGDRPR
jgi:hypothetical protein